MSPAETCRNTATRTSARCAGGLLLSLSHPMGNASRSPAPGFCPGMGTATWREEATLRGFLNAVNSVVFSPDGQRLATGGSNPDDAVKLWDVDSWQELLTLEGTGYPISLTAFSPDGNAIGTVSKDGILHVWRAPSWAEINAAEAKEKAEIKQP